MAATAHVSYQFGEDQAIDVQVGTDEGFPDAIDEISRRVVWVLAESIDAVNAAIAKVNAQVGVEETT